MRERAERISWAAVKGWPVEWLVIDVIGLGQLRRRDDEPTGRRRRMAAG